jgi:pimeloyl-ACP methyl ester carboxylesterase
MAEFELRHVRIHGHSVGYRHEGRGPNLVLLHGIAGSSDAWRAVMPALAARFTVIAPDFMGHGQSAKPMGDYSLGAHAAGIRDLLGVLGVDRATIVGQSFGGGVAMQLAYQHPELCERLVLVDSGGLGRDVNWVLRLLSLPGAEYVMPALFPPVVKSAGELVTGLLSRLGIRSEHAAEMWSAYTSLTDAESRQAFLRTVRSVIDPGGQTVSAMDRLYLASNMPTLIVWGDRDRIIPVSHAYDAHRAIPGSRLEIMRGAGHFPHIEQPEHFVEVLVDFIDTTQPSRYSPRQIRRLLTGQSGPVAEGGAAPAPGAASAAS